MKSYLSRNCKSRHLRLGQLLCLLLFSFAELNATHIRGGEITARRINNNSLTYEITFTGYRDQDSQIEFGGAGTINLGDGKQLQGPFITTIEDLGNGTDKVFFTITHAYDQPDSRGYLISYTEEFRNSGVINLNDGNSAGITFYVETLLVIYPFVVNSTPVFTAPPDFFAAVGVRYRHNPGMYDPDGDSLVYRFTDVKSSRFVKVNGYKELIDPNFYSDFDQGNEANSGPPTLTLDPGSGDLIWDAPGDVAYHSHDCESGAEYNVAFRVEEWRKVFGSWKLMGYVERDMQIIVCSGENSPPILEESATVCIVAGNTIEKSFSGTDPDDDPFTLTAYGSPFEVQQPAVFFINEDGSLNLSWATQCDHINNQPYKIYIKANDHPSSGSSLSDYKALEVSVVGPIPTGMETQNLNNGSIQISWDAYICENADSIQIWRRIGDYEIDECDLSMLSQVGYHLAGKVGVDQQSFIDDNHGTGLDENVSYKYKLAAEFSRGDDRLADLLTSIEQNPSISVKIFPNPSSGSIHISSFEKIGSYKIFNLAGEELLMGELDHKREINGLTPVLSSGLYYIQFFGSTNRLVDMQRLIIVNNER